MYVCGGGWVDVYVNVCVCVCLFVFVCICVVWRVAYAFIALLLSRAPDGNE